MEIKQSFSSGEQVTLLTSGQAFFQTLEKMIDEAKEEIHLQVYIFEDDETGRRIAEALFRAALRGVAVYLLLDGFGSYFFPEKISTRLKDAGVRIKFFGRLFSRGRFHLGRRLHRKVIVFDRTTAIVTGLNISNNYNDVNDKRAWLDFAVVVEGAIVLKLYALCLRRWIKKPLRKSFIEKVKSRKKLNNIHGNIYLRQNDWVRGLNEANASYRREIKHAKKSLFIVGGYFLPGGNVRRALKRAVERGVDIQIIVAEESDVQLQHLALEYLYQWMIRNRIRIYEYITSNVHGKVLIADKHHVSIGSYDLNSLSTLSNVELNLDIKDAQFASTFHDLLEKIANQECRLITAEELYKRSNIWRRFKHWFAYHFTKSLFVLSLWLARNDEEEYQ